MAYRIPRMFGSVLLLVGAFLVGWVLHHTLVVGDLAATSPVSLGVTVAGIALMAGGHRLEQEFDPSDYVRGTDEEDEDEDDFDESMSPVEGEWLEGHDRDDG